MQIISSPCKHHDIVWDSSSIEIRYANESDQFVGDDFEDAVEFKGKCLNCQRIFLKTYLDPTYSELKQPDNELENAYRESIKTQQFKDLESVGGIN